MTHALTGKIALITGAAGAIGLATAILLAARGALIVATDMEDADFGPLRAAIPDEGHLLVLEADVTDEAAFGAVVAQTVERFGTIDIFFNNAGIEGPVAPIPDFPTDGFRKVMEVNVTGIFLGLKLVIPIMAKAGLGSIINSSSVAGMTAPALRHVASKHPSWLDAWRRSNGGKKHPSNLVQPGPVRKVAFMSLSEGRPQPRVPAPDVHDGFARPSR